MPAGKYNITIEQGAQYSVRFRWQDDNKDPVDLTPYTARIQIREKKDSTTTLYDSDTTGSDIVLGGTAGTIDWTILTAVTNDMDFESGVWDCELSNTSTSEVTRLLEGRVALSKQVTQ